MLNASSLATGFSLYSLTGRPEAFSYISKESKCTKQDFPTPFPLHPSQFPFQVYSQ